MLTLALRNLWRRPLRNALALAGLAAAVAVLASLSAFGTGYRRALGTELDRMGMQLMLVPLGCPYDAAARVLKGNTLENSLPESALEAVRRDPAVAVAAPLLIAALPRPAEARTDMWMGIDTSVLALKPWWRAQSGAGWFARSNSVLLGSEAAAIELRAPGDKLHSPEANTTLVVSGVLERSGTSDDSLFFVPLPTAQAMFGQTGRLSAIAVRLRDPESLSETSKRLQQIPGAQVVTMTEMMGTFLNLVGGVRALLLAVSAIALTVGSLGVFSTLLAAVVERTSELALFRALGASRSQVFAVLALEALVLTAGAATVGLALAAVSGRFIESTVKFFVPLPPTETLFALTPAALAESFALGVGIGLLAVLYPAWRASRVQPARALLVE